MSYPRVSIIIPAYNEERYLGACLEAIAAQTLQPYEVIVVDNASTDRTAEIAAQYPFVKLLQEPIRGRAYAQATGFNAASGDVVARIDADAVIPPNWVDHVATFYADPAATQKAWTSGASFYNIRFTRGASWAYGLVAFGVNKALTGHASLWGSSMALPEPMWRQVASDVCLRADLHEDLDVSIHLHRAGYAITYDKRIKVGVELRPAYASVSTLWEYLKLWPRTLRAHQIASWPFSWVVNLALFVGMPVLARRKERLG